MNHTHYFYPVNFIDLLSDLDRTMKNQGRMVQTEKWQSQKLNNRPGTQMVELLHTSLTVPMSSEDPTYYQKQLGPNLPWADNHFEERVCGYPINPGVEWANWPWANKAQDSLDENGQFNHNYMERYWTSEGIVKVPTKDIEDFKKAREQDDGLLSEFPRGLRHEYGDLEDLCELLAVDPTTRQAYLPIWFPEDTGTVHSGRKPCTLGYHFIMRDGELDVTYYIRSCDFYRHFADDVYLTIKLVLYVLDRCREINPKGWGNIIPGSFIMHITSLHMFINDYLAKYNQHPRLP